MEHEHSVYEIKRLWLRIFVIVSIIGAGIFGFFNYVQSTDILTVAMNISKNSNLKPDEKIRLEFSKPVLKEKTQSVLKIEPRAEYVLRWSEDRKALEILPKERWENGTKYELSITGGESFLGVDFVASASFSIEEMPEVVSVSPIRGEKDVIVDIEDPIVINFNRSVNDYDIRIVFSPAGEFAHEFNGSKDSIKILPKEKLEQGKRHDVFVEIKHKKASEKEYKKIFESYFVTKRIGVEQWSEDPTIRLYQAKNYTPPRLDTGKYIDIDLKNQIMVIFENGEALDSYLISSGRSGMNTPEGSFQIYNKHPRPWSKKYSLYMPYWMAITSSGEFGIHELPEWPGGYKEGANHLGIPVSHGCVRLGIGPAERVYNWAEIGTPVITHY